MEETFTTPVVTSRAADQNIENIRSQHADILDGLTNQSAKVQAFNQQKQVQAQQDAQMKAQAKTDQMKIDAQSRKDSMEMEQKNRELELKRMALTLD